MLEINCAPLKAAILKEILFKLVIGSKGIDTEKSLIDFNNNLERHVQQSNLYKEGMAEHAKELNEKIDEKRVKRDEEFL